MTITREQFASDFLLELSKPVSVNNLKSVVVWASSENTQAENNPLATTLQFEGSTNFNEVGVKNYATYQEGLAATKATILNGDYGAILACFDKSASPAETCSTIENSVWGSKPSSQLVADVLADYDAYANTPVGGTGSEVDPNTPTETTTKPELQIGSQGAEVEKLQTFLNEDCGQHLTVDGVFGEFTQLSVRNFQRFFGIQVDGIVGPQTWSVVDYVEALHGQPES